jgi:hypothetical protein
VRGERRGGQSYRARNFDGAAKKRRSESRALYESRDAVREYVDQSGDLSLQGALRAARETRKPEPISQSSDLVLLVRGNALHIPLKGQSVHMTLCSPPYY